MNIEMYAEIAPSYNKLYKEEQLHKLKAISKILKVNSKDKLLDVGCGTGISTNYFDCDCVGIDPCEFMIKKGKGKLVLGYGENLPFSDKYFDVVICVTALHNFNDIEKGILEMKRVLKDDGKIVISVLKKSVKISLVSKLIKKHFGLLKRIDEGVDIIFYN